MFATNAVLVIVLRNLVFLLVRTEFREKVGLVRIYQISPFGSCLLRIPLYFLALGYLLITLSLKFAKWRAMMFLAQLEFQTFPQSFFFFSSSSKRPCKAWRSSHPLGFWQESWPVCEWGSWHSWGFVLATRDPGAFWNFWAMWACFKASAPLGELVLWGGSCDFIRQFLQAGQGS